MTKDYIKDAFGDDALLDDKAAGKAIELFEKSSKEANEVNIESKVQEADALVGRLVFNRDKARVLMLKAGMYEKVARIILESVDKFKLFKLLGP